MLVSYKRVMLLSNGNRLQAYLAASCVLFHLCGRASSAASSRIAVIGGGIGGTAVAHFVSELVPNAKIDLFEKSSLLGGRLNVTTVYGNGYETGGSVIHGRNKYAVELAKKFGLEHRSDTGEAMSIIKDDEYVFNTSKWTIVTIIKVLARYGLDMNRLDSIVGKLLDKFSRIYEMQDEGKVFLSPADLLEAADPYLFNLTKSDFHSYLKEQGLGELIIDELIQAITFVNYGQDLKMHAFVGGVSAAGADSSLWSVNKGNRQLPENLLKNSNAKLHLNTEVREIVKNPGTDKDGSPTYTLIGSSSQSLGTFDQVVVALPLDAMTSSTQLKFTNFGTTPPYEFPPTRKYHRTFTTIIAGHVHPKYKFRTSILSCTPNWYNSISLIHPTILVVAEKYPVYKIFSSEPLTDSQLDSIFAERNFKEIHDWLAYPEYDQVPPQLPSFILAPNLYFLNAIEWAASAMEMSLISAKNIALLISQELNAV